MSIRANLALLGDLDTLNTALAPVLAERDAELARLIAAGYAPSPMRVIERLAREVAEQHEERARGEHW